MGKTEATMLFFAGLSVCVSFFVLGIWMLVAKVKK